MPTNKITRTRRALRLAFVLAAILPCPFIARAQDAGPAASAPALTPPALLEGVAPALPELPVGSEPVSVVLELTIDKDGVGRDAVVIGSAGEELDRAALSASAQLRFHPATRDGEPIVARIPFRFDFHAALPPPAPVPVTAPPAATAPAPAGVSEELTLEVEGQRPPRETTVHALDVSETRKMPGTNGDPLRAIEALPGVARPSALDSQLIVRGSAPNDTAIFIDGIQIPVAYHLGGQASVVQNDALERIEFRPGNFGSDYGRAMGGVVELGLRAPRRDRVGGIVQLDNFDGRLMIEGPLGKKTRFMLSARRSWVDAWIGSVDKDIKSAPVYYDGQAVLEHDFTKRTTARLFFIGSDDRVKVFSDAPSGSDPGQGGKFSLGTQFTRLALRIDSKLTDDLSVRHTMWWGTDQFNVAAGPFLQNISAQELGSRSELRVHLSAWLTGAIGIDAQFAKYDVKLRVPPFDATDAPPNPSFARPDRVINGDVWLIRPALYAMLDIKPIAGFSIVPSVRADYAQDTKQVTLDPRVTARADVHPSFPRTTLKGGVGFYSQPPQGVESVKPFGSSGVHSNRALHLSSGIEQELAPGLSLSLEGFYKQLSKLVVARVSENSDNVGAAFSNTGSGRAYGGETLLRYKDPTGRYFGWVAYTLMRSERRNDDSEAYHLFQYDQTHILTALGNAQLRRGWSVGARFRYVTGSPYTPNVGGVVDLDAGAYAPIAGKTYGARLPAFQQLDLRVDKTWQLGSLKLVAYLELRNAYNRKNAEAINERYDFSRSERVHGLPILPVIGLRGEL
ncbi:MAG: TonB family protein / TonB-dependent receptor [Myxococcaceae bacterium]|nr:TonB family protein / TonB-dependent receptor [Myxococcaceae bacterium]